MYDHGIANMQKEKKQENPFYDNHVFKKDDIDRLKNFNVSRWDPSWWFAKKYVQVNEGLAFHFKQRNDGCILLYKVESLQNV